MWYPNDMFYYMFIAEFVTLLSLKVPSGNHRIVGMFCDSFFLFFFILGILIYFLVLFLIANIIICSLFFDSATILAHTWELQLGWLLALHPSSRPTHSTQNRTYCDTWYSARCQIGFPEHLVTH